MITCSSSGLEPEENNSSKVRRPGRPRAIPSKLEPAVVELHKRGYGYRAVARILRNEYGISADFSTVKRVLKRLGCITGIVKSG
jgi:transposase